MNFRTSSIQTDGHFNTCNQFRVRLKEYFCKKERGESHFQEKEKEVLLDHNRASHPRMKDADVVVGTLFLKLDAESGYLREPGGRHTFWPNKA